MPRVNDLFPAETSGPDETRALGRRLARILPRPWILALYGELGVGKTHFVKGLADGLGFDGSLVTSPTFTLVHELRGPAAALFHMDAYRIETPADLASFDLDEMLYSSDSCAIEWPDRIESMLPAGTIRLLFTHSGAHRRRIELLG